jgi:hypothetical protein
VRLNRASLRKQIYPSQKVLNQLTTTARRQHIQRGGATPWQKPRHNAK